MGNLRKAVLIKEGFHQLPGDKQDHLRKLISSLLTIQQAGELPVAGEGRQDAPAASRETKGSGPNRD
jgi:hypothetical protein